MKSIFAAAVLLSMCVFTWANVVRPAHDFTWQGAGRATSLRSLKGQPVVLLIAKSDRVGAFKSQVNKLKELYQNFASRKVVFVAAFEEGEGTVKSDIPFAIAANGSKVAADYGVSDPFNIVIIGKDGNIDLQTPKVIPASRVRDVLINSFVVQAGERKR